MHITKFKNVVFLFFSWTALAFGQNQTPDVSPILPPDSLPFRMRIELLKKEGEPFLLPNGIQSYVFGTHKGKWLLLAGRTNGMHGFNQDNNNFPPSKQNLAVYVINPKKKKISSRILTPDETGLTQDQIDSLSVTSPQFDQLGKTLYITGGYGYKTIINDFTTFDKLTAIDIPGLMRWVKSPNKRNALKSIRQISHPIFKVNGGIMHNLKKKGPTLLIFGQDFEGAYFSPNSTQVYTNEVRKFFIKDDGKKLKVKVLSSSPKDENYRRRDLNIVPVVKKATKRKISYEALALSGVFTLTNGAWTVPVTISNKGIPHMENPLSPKAFKQGMNNYQSSFVSLFSKKHQESYIVLFGGITYEYFQNGTFVQDAQLPFTNQVTTIKKNNKDEYTQYLMDAEYPDILSTESNPGNQLLFGSGSHFIPAHGHRGIKFKHRIYNFDKITKPLVLGYIVGGIQSTLMNTNTMSDSAASPYIFKVIIEPR